MEDGEKLDYVDTIKVRFSDHMDYHGSDATIRIDDVIETIRNEFDEYVATEISEEDYVEKLDEAIASVDQFVAEYVELA